MKRNGFNTRLTSQTDLHCDSSSKTAMQIKLHCLVIDQSIMVTISIHLSKPKAVKRFQKLHNVFGTISDNELSENVC